MSHRLTNPWHPWHRRPACESLWHRRPACEENHRRDAGATSAGATSAGATSAGATNAGATVRAGLTLIELMVVISIIVILVVSSLPALLPALEKRRTREAARLTNTALGRARGVAIANGRPAGLLIQRMRTKGNGSLLLFQAVVPPPYAGDTIDAKLVLTAQGGVGRDGRIRLQAAEDPNSRGTFSGGLVKVGDHIQFNYQGPLYKITGGNQGTGGFIRPPLTVTAQLGKGAEVPWTAGNQIAVPYQIFRQPIKTAAEPAQLPAGTVIDLGQSRESRSGSVRPLPGLRSESQFPIIITFAADGSLDRIYHSGGLQVRPQGSVHLLIGKLELLGAENLQELSNLWVSVGRQTGLVTTSKISKGGNGLRFADEKQTAGGL